MIRGRGIWIGGLLLFLLSLDSEHGGAYQPPPMHLEGLTSVRVFVFVWREVPNAQRETERLTEAVKRQLTTKAHLQVVNDDDTDAPLFRLHVFARHLTCVGHRLLILETEVELIEKVTLVRAPSIPIWGSGCLPTWSEGAFGTDMTSSAEQEIDRQVDWLMGLFCQAVVEMNKGSDPAAQTQR